MQTHLFTSLVVALSLVVGLAQALQSAEPSGPTEPTRTMPADLESGPGLSARYPLDEGIDADPAVVFVENFESEDYASKWDQKREIGSGPFAEKGTVEVVTDPAEVHGGRRSLKITARMKEGATFGNASGGDLFKSFAAKGYDKLYARYYCKFSADSGYLSHFVTLGGLNPPTPWPNPQAGQKPNGDDRFSTELGPSYQTTEPPMGPWRWYTYWCEMKPDGHGDYWGNVFRSDPEVPAPRDKWICVEIMLQLNTVGQRDGAMAAWVDGKPLGLWTGFRWRTAEGLKISYFWLQHFYSERGAPQLVSSCWFDDIVLATRYIGPKVSTPVEPGPAKE